jgi:hypothetical protein
VFEERNQLTDGVIRDEDADEQDSELKNETAQRWSRIARTAVNVAGLVLEYLRVRWRHLRSLLASGR